MKQAAKMLETLSADVDDAQEQFVLSQSEVKKAVKCLKAAEKKREVVTIDSDSDDEDEEGNSKKKIKPEELTKFFSNSVKKVSVFGFSSDSCDASTTKDVPDKKEFTTKSSVNEGQGISSTVEHFPQAESPTMTWKNLWSQMRKAGWVYCADDRGVVWEYWVHPSATKMRKRDMIRDCTEGVHYFSSVKAIQQYSIANLGWKGEGGTKTERVKKRKTNTDKEGNNGKKKVKLEVKEEEDTDKEEDNEDKEVAKVEEIKGEDTNTEDNDNNSSIRNEDDSDKKPKAKRNAKKQSKKTGEKNNAPVCGPNKVFFSTNENRAFQLGCVRYGWGNWDRVQTFVISRTVQECAQYAAAVLVKHRKSKNGLIEIMVGS